MAVSHANSTLTKFITKELPKALKQEENNTSHIYFHQCGTEWVAVERSAYAVCQRYSLTKRIVLVEYSKYDQYVVLLPVNESTMRQMPLNVRIPLFPYCQWKQSLFEMVKGNSKLR